MTSVLNLLRYVPKQTALIVAFAIALVSTFTVFATPDVTVEGWLDVSNQTDKPGVWKSDSVDADNNDVVKFRIYYHNTELSISNKIAEDLSIKVDFPEGAGSEQLVKATIKGSNTNTVVDTAKVNLDNPEASLEFISGSAVWKHNVGPRDNVTYQNDKLADSAILGGKFIRLENQKPCFEYEAWVTFEAKVVTPEVEIEKQVANSDSDNWGEYVRSVPGDEVKFLLTVKNTGNTRVNVTKVEDFLPAGLTYVAGSSVLTDTANPNGVALIDGVANGGLPLGEISAHGVAYIEFRATVNDAEEFECGYNKIKNLAVVHTKTNSDQDTANVKVTRECTQEEPVYDCEALNLSIIDWENREVNATAQISMSDDVTLEGVSIDFGDGTVVDGNDVNHTYAENGEYQVVATVSFNVGDEIVKVTCEEHVCFDEEIKYCTIPGKEHLKVDDPNCKKEPKTPPELPNTGAGTLILSLFSATTAASAGYGLIKSRR